MSNAKRTALLVKAIEASLAGDSDAICELFTEDVRGWSPTLRISSIAELAVELEDHASDFSDVDLQHEPLDVGGAHACVEWVASATPTAPLELADDLVIEPTGRRCTLRGVTIAEFVDGRICAFREYWDDVTLFERLRLLPAD